MVAYNHRRPESTHFRIDLIRCAGNQPGRQIKKELHVQVKQFLDGFFAVFSQQITWNKQEKQDEQKTEKKITPQNQHEAKIADALKKSNKQPTMVCSHLFLIILTKFSSVYLFAVSDFVVRVLENRFHNRQFEYSSLGS